MVLSATHTHSGPAGFLQYVLFEVTSLGFIEQTFNALVDGIARVNTSDVSFHISHYRSDVKY